MYKGMKYAPATALIALLAVGALIGCKSPGSDPVSTLVVTSVKQGTTTSHGLARQVLAPTFTPPSIAEAPDFEISGPPDYLIVTLKKITLAGSFDSESSPFVAWEGSESLQLDGTGAIDAGAIPLSVPVGTIGSVELTFASQARIKGSILDKMMYIDTSNSTGTVSAYTLSGLAWDASTRTGGGADYASFGFGPAEEMSISLDTAASEFTVTTASSSVIARGDSPTLTILFDLSRVLRFYNGKRGTDGSDGIGSTRAYFYSFSVFPQSVAAFIGQAGTIQGYEYHFNGYENHDTLNPGAVPGWMTLVFDPQGRFLSGTLMGDSDTAWTVGKGAITSYVTGSGAADIQYAIGGGVPFGLHNFVKQSTVGEYTPLATWEWNSSTYRNGEAYFRLALQE